MTKKTLLIEKNNFTFNVSKNSLKESLNSSLFESSGKMIVKGVPATILGEKNFNGRIYTKEEMSRAISECIRLKKFENKSLTCSADDHPDSTFVKPIQASHVVIDAYIKEINGKNILFNDWLILDTDNGRNLKALLKEGVSVGTSIRGLGILEESTSEIQDYQYLGTDAVGEPSAGTFISNKEYNIEVVIETTNENMKTKIKKILESELDGTDSTTVNPDLEVDKTSKSFGSSLKDIDLDGEGQEKGNSSILKNDGDIEIKPIDTEALDQDLDDNEKNNEKDGDIEKLDLDKKVSVKPDIDLEIKPIDTEALDQDLDDNEKNNEKDGDIDSIKIENIRIKAQKILSKEISEEILNKELELKHSKELIEELCNRVIELCNNCSNLKSKLDKTVKESIEIISFYMESDESNSIQIQEILNTYKESDKKSSKLLSSLIEASKKDSKTFEALIEASRKDQFNFSKLEKTINLLLSINEQLILDNKKLKDKKEIKYSSKIESTVIRSNKSKEIEMEKIRFKY